MAKYTLTYSTLLTKLQNWAENEETTFVTELDTVINMACMQAARDLKLEKFRKRETGSFTPAVATITMPSDALMVDSLLVNDGTDNQPMEERAGDVIELYSGSGLPLYWTEQDTATIRVAPAPDSGYSYILYGMQRPETLDAENETNWVTDHVPDLLFTACQKWSHLFMKNATWAERWQLEYNTALERAGDEFGQQRRNSETVAPSPDASTGRRTEKQ